eukprot:15366059-Ditylum_brightwellii.AAC.1
MDINQDKPGIVNWQLWRRAMKIWADEDTLHQPLGKWYKSGNDLDSTCSNKTAPVRVVTTDGTLTWQGAYCYGITGDIIHRQPATIKEFTVALEKWEQDIIDNVEILASLNKLMVFVQQGKCLIATDASDIDDMMSFAWKVVAVDGNAYFCHASPAFSKKSSFRLEAYGILSML